MDEATRHVERKYAGWYQMKPVAETKNTMMHDYGVWCFDSFGLLDIPRRHGLSVRFQALKRAGQNGDDGTWQPKLVFLARFAASVAFLSAYRVHRHIDHIQPPLRIQRHTLSESFPSLKPQQVGDVAISRYHDFSTSQTANSPRVPLPLSLSLRSRASLSSLSSFSTSSFTPPKSGGMCLIATLGLPSTYLKLSLIP